MSQTTTATSARSAPTRPPRGGVRGNPGLTLVAVALGVIMVALDGTIVAVANPTIQAQLHASLADIQWVTNGYLLSLAVTLIAIGKFGDRFGHRTIFLIGIVGFGATSAAVGLSGDLGHSIGLVIAFRVAQGVFGAMLQPTALALLRTTFPVERLSTALGIWGGAVGAASAAGPIVGGLLVQHVNWESIFYINVPVGVIALVLGLIVLRATRSSRAASSFDVLGTVLLSAALFLLIWGLIKGSGYGWGSTRTLTFFGGAVLAGLLFALREAKTREPLLPLRLFRSLPLSAGTVLVLALMFALFGAMFFMTFYLEDVRGLDSVATGVRLLPLTAMLIVGSPVAGALITRAGPRFPMVGGMLLAAVGLYGLSRVSVTSSLNATILWFILLGLGLSPVIVGATDVIVGNASRELAGVAGGLQSTAMQLGGTLGTAILGAVMSARVSSLLPARWAAAHLPHLSAAELAQVKSAVSVGVAPVPAGTPPRLAAPIIQVSHSTFVSGMTSAFLIAAIVAVAGAVIGLLTRQGVHAEGDTAVASPHLEATAPEPLPVAPPTVEVERGIPVSGYVRGAESLPVSGAAVTLISLDGRQLDRSVAQADGSYRIHTPSGGSYVLIAAADGYAPRATTILVAEAPVSHDLLLTGTSGLAGVVRSADSGAPVAGAVVIVTDIRGDVVGSGQTDSLGEFALVDLVPGTVTLAVSSPKHRPLALTAEIGASGTTRVEVDLRPGARVSGMVSGGGRPLNDAMVTLVAASGNVVASTTTGADGTYAFSDLDRGSYTVIATGYPPRATSVTVSGDDVDDHDIELAHGVE